MSILFKTVQIKTKEESTATVNLKSGRFDTDSAVIINNVSKAVQN